MTPTATLSQRAFTRSGLPAAAAALLIVLAASAQAVPHAAGSVAPETLRDTGLYSDFDTLRIDERHVAFSPRYPLWTDGATKRRWISLPQGAAIDASDPDAWNFPAGTRLWKEFSFGGQRVETRYMERRPDGQWLYATYAWTADGREARRVSDRGRRNAYPLAGGRSHAIPGIGDCKVCHQGGGTEVLGFSAIQLSPRRDPAARHANAESETDLALLIARGLLVGWPESTDAPEIDGATAIERAALGYLHGNCAHCHNEQGPLRNVGLFLRQTADGAAQRTITSTFDRPMNKRAPGQSADATLRIEPQHPERSALVQRMASRVPAQQMPPLGTELTDDAALDLIRRWIATTRHVSPKPPQEEKTQ